MNTVSPQLHPFDTEVLQFWARQALLQRAALEAIAAHLR